MAALEAAATASLPSLTTARLMRSKSLSTPGSGLREVGAVGETQKSRSKCEIWEKVGCDIWEKWVRWAN